MKRAKIECAVCCEVLNKSNRKLVECPCGYMACRECCKTYILQEESRCMHCHKEWDREFLSLNFPMSFINTDMKRKNEERLVEIETSLLPATQLVIEKRKENRELRIALEKEIRDLCLRIGDLRNTCDALQHSPENVQEIMREKRVFTRACPVDDCRGFLSTRWKCGMCEKTCCSFCHKVKDDMVEHTCDPNDVASVELLKKDSKPCPKCSAMIFKIDGCHIMFCTVCHTSFHWLTLRISTRNVHNPHYFEWLNQTGNVHEEKTDENGCAILRVEDVDRTYRELFRLLRECMDVDMRRYQVNEVNNIDLRIRYLEQHIDKETFGRLLQQRMKTQEKNQAIYSLLDMFTHTLMDLFHGVRPKVDEIKHQEFKNQVFLLNEYVMKQMSSIQKRFGCTIRMIRLIEYIESNTFSRLRLPVDGTPFRRIFG